MATLCENLEAAWLVSGIAIGIIAAVSSFLWWSFIQFVKQHSRFYADRVANDPTPINKQEPLNAR